MGRYIRADLKRIHAKKSHVVCLLFIYLIIAAIVSYNCMQGGQGYASAANMIAGTLAIYLGTLVFFAVFSADTHTKTMQIAIGSGLSRTQVVLAKVMEGLILTVLYDLIAGLILCLLPAVFHVSMSGAAVSAVITSVIGSILDSLLFFNLSMIVIFATLRANGGEILYILFAFQIITGLITGALGYLNVQFGFPDLTGLLFSSLSSSFFSNPAGNVFCLIGMAVYLIVPIYIAKAVFAKKELEF
jgi:ABC-type transport system involved in multi-copper enzyme maturation permease subunit